MRSAITGLILMLSLSACGNINSDTVLPDTPVYSGKTQDALAVEVAGGSCPIATSFAIDYNIMQGQTFAIKGVK